MGMRVGWLGDQAVAVAALAACSRMLRVCCAPVPNSTSDCPAHWKHLTLVWCLHLGFHPQGSYPRQRRYALGLQPHPEDVRGVTRPRCPPRWIENLPAPKDLLCPLCLGGGVACLMYVWELGKTFGSPSSSAESEAKWKEAVQFLKNILLRWERGVPCARLS